MLQHEVRSHGFALLIILGMFSLLIPLVLSVWVTGDFALQIELQREQTIKNRLLAQSVLRVLCVQIGRSFENLLLQCGARKSPLILTIIKQGSQSAKIIILIQRVDSGHLNGVLKMEIALVENEKRLYDIRCLLQRKNISSGKKNVIAVHVSHVTVGDCI